MMGARTTPDEWLMACWKDLMNGAALADVAYVKGAIDALCQTGQIDAIYAELWQRRIETCPENTKDDPGHIGGRAWCSYCGEVPLAEQGEFRQPTESGRIADDLDPANAVA